MSGDGSVEPVDALRADDGLDDDFEDFEEDDELDDEDVDDDADDAEDDEDDSYDEYEQYYPGGDEEPIRRRRRQEWE